MESFIKAEFNIKATQDALGTFIGDQIAFVTAKSLTDLATASQRLIRENIPRRFNVHSTWVQKGVRVKPALKKDIQNYGMAEAEVKHIDPYMEQHEVGGDKELRSHGKSVGKKNIAIPEKGFAANARTGSGKIKTSMRPKTLLKDIGKPGRQRKWGKHRKPKPYIIKSKFNGAALIAIRTTDARYPVEYLYVLSKHAHIKQRFDFEKQTRVYVEGNASKVFAENMMAAIKSNADRRNG